MRRLITQDLELIWTEAVPTNGLLRMRDEANNNTPTPGPTSRPAYQLMLQAYRVLEKLIRHEQCFYQCLIACSHQLDPANMPGNYGVISTCSDINQYSFCVYSF